MDGTLAYDDGWHGPLHIGDPIPAMMARVKQWLKQGIRVKIFTARASLEEHIPPVREWLYIHGLPNLCLYDDRCVQVIPNTGELVSEDMNPETQK